MYIDVDKCHQPGQGPSAQDTVSVSRPGQDAPPCAGGGSSHSRVRVLIPAPHVTLQLLQGDHVSQLPFTGETKV